MKYRLIILAPIACFLASACTSEESATAEADSISEDTAAYSGISADEAVTLVGTEPFWGAEITGEDLRWTTPENIEGVTIQVARFAGNNGLGYSGELEGEAMQIAVTPGECSDGMSDRTYPFTATITIGDRQLTGCGYTDVQKYSGEETP
ncbi:hypothetical protein P7228_09580 [Altererythrobacter arenosus]|uniref:Lipoprotein n=1 Tax=Altererythrobacter arenosus TaxID=3032592 RepID=A0ABY8FW39_9SPHN|nr:hypothetical protein [Altererythrobacter sp. CAU 1644]WFL76249.1 hypothetical protein P7228_09580 [Altererythrobacter sp. CAU 1644]